jgi:hypothetical protein
MACALSILFDVGSGEATAVAWEHETLSSRCEVSAMASQREPLIRTIAGRFISKPSMQSDRVNMNSLCGDTVCGFPVRVKNSKFV